MAAVNKVGLEAEFILRGKDNSIIYPGLHGFSTDEFVVLGEFRAEPGTTREETLANFMKAWYEILFQAKKQGYTVDINGFAEITPKFYTEILRKMGTKSIAQAKNIHPEIDLLELSDAVVVEGKIQKHYISTGLHIHFSSTVEKESTDKRVEVTYSPVKIPLAIGGNTVAEMGFYQKERETTVEKKVSVSVSRITKPVLYQFVKSLDETLLAKFNLGIPLKYRNPGFYEIKGYGFEYRSLPFSTAVLSDIANIVDFSFNLLEDLDL